jgi:hypothetical protein
MTLRHIFTSRYDIGRRCANLFEGEDDTGAVFPTIRDKRIYVYSSATLGDIGKAEAPDWP